MSIARESPRDALRKELGEARARVCELEKAIWDLRDGEELPREDFDVLVCRVGTEHIGFSLHEVEEVVPIAETTALPEAPPWVTGLLDLRGDVLTVLDVAARLDLSSREVELSDLVVVIDDGSRRLGLVVQEIFDVRHVSPLDLQTAAPDTPHGPYLRGLFHDEGEVVLLFSGKRLVACSDIPGAEP